MPDSAQANRDAAAQLTQTLVAQQKAYEAARGLDREKQQKRLMALAEKRHKSLAALMESDPSAVFRVYIPGERRSGMPAQVEAMLLQESELDGELEVLYEDREDGDHRLRHFLRTYGQERFELNFTGKTPSILNGTSVRASGLLLLQNPDQDSNVDGYIALDSSANSIETQECCDGPSGSASGSPALPNTTGEQRTLVLLVDFQDQPGSQPWTTAQIDNVVFGQVNSFYQENSGGQAWLTGMVRGWYTLPLDSTSCDEWAIAQYARDAAAADGINLADFRRFVFIFPRNACTWGGLGTIGGSTTYSWINGNPTLNYIGHELGHNFGLYHSKALDCIDSPIEGSCGSLNYGDTLDIMGNPNPGHFNAFQKERLGWFGAEAIGPIQPIESGGSFEIGPYAQNGSTAPTALKILKGTDTATGEKSWYYIEYRQAIGFDDFLSSNQNVLNGVVIHQASDGDPESSHLLDMTPGSSNWFDMDDAALVTGNSFADTGRGITISTAWADAIGASVNVTMDMEACTVNPLTLGFTSNSSVWAAAGAEVIYRLTVRNNDSAGCASGNIDLSATVPNGWAQSLSPSGINLSPGESAAFDLSVTSQSTAVNGFYDIEIVASHGGSAQSATATYVVDTPEANTAPVATDDAVTTDAGVPVPVDVLSNDSDPDADPLTVTTASNGSNGRVSLNGDGRITYTPDAGFAGTDSFTYTISDGRGGTDAASVLVTVEPVAPEPTNNAPVAAADSAGTAQETAVLIAVLANDSDPDNDRLDVVSVTQGSNGQVSINADGTLTYLPGRRFKGTDSFVYTITDGTDTDQAVVTVTVERSGSKSGGGGKGGGGKPSK